MSGLADSRFPLAVPDRLRLINKVWPSTRSRAKMSPTPVVLVSMRSVARLLNTTNRPSALMTGERDEALPVPVLLAFALASISAWSCVSQTTMAVLVHCVGAEESGFSKTIKRPFALMLAFNPPE